MIELDGVAYLPMGKKESLKMATKAASDMSLAELEKALNGAKERLAGMEKEAADYRKSVQSYVLEFGKRQRQFEKAFGMRSERATGPRARIDLSNQRGGGARASRGTVAFSIQETLKAAKDPIGVAEIHAAVGGSKPSIAQTLMKLVQSGKVQRYNKDGKTISKSDKTQRAKGYALA